MPLLEKKHRAEISEQIFHPGHHASSSLQLQAVNLTSHPFQSHRRGYCCFGFARFICPAVEDDPSLNKLVNLQERHCSVLPEQDDFLKVMTELLAYQKCALFTHRLLPDHVFAASKAEKY